MKPAFYALERGGWRDYVTLLHVPYTAWHLSYVVVGGCLAAERLLGSTRADRPRVLPRDGNRRPCARRARRSSARHGDSFVGARGARRSPRSSPPARSASRWRSSFSLWILPLIAIGAFLVPAYNLELFGGRFHSDSGSPSRGVRSPWSPATSPATGTPRLVAVRRCRRGRRRSPSRSGGSRRPCGALAGRSSRSTATLGLASGDREPITRELLVSAPEGALRLLTVATVLIAAALVAVRL